MLERKPEETQKDERPRRLCLTGTHGTDALRMFGGAPHSYSLPHYKWGAVYNDSTFRGRCVVSTVDSHLPLLRGLWDRNDIGIETGPLVSPPELETRRSEKVDDPLKFNKDTGRESKSQQ